MQIDPNNLDPSVVNMAKAIRTVETNGNFQAKGQSGEYGAYQFMPDTWKGLAGHYLGDPNADLSKENQNKVAYAYILDLKNQGFQPDQVASIWNHGTPNYQGVVGTNDQGVHYDTPKYVNSVMNKYMQLKSGNNNGQTLPNPSQIPTEQPLANSVGGFVGNTLGNFFPSLGNVIGSIGQAVLHPIDTISNLVGAGVGGAEKLAGMNTPDTQKFDALTSALGQRFGITKLVHGDVVGAGKDLLTTVQNDPAGFALDLATALEGGGEALRAASLSDKASELARFANAPLTAESRAAALDTAIKSGELGTGAQIGTKMASIGQNIDPLRLTAKAAGKALSPIGNFVQSAPSRILNDYLGTRNSDLLHNENPAQYLLDRGYLAKSDGNLLMKVQNDANAANAEIVAKASQAPGNLVSEDLINKTIDAVHKYYGGKGDIGTFTREHIASVLSRDPSFAGLLNNPTLSWEDANTVRVAMDKIAQSSRPTDAATSLLKRIQKTAANYLRDEIQRVTGTSAEFSRYHNAITVIKQLSRKVPKGLRLSFKDAAFGGLGTLAGGTLGGFGAVAAEHALESPLGSTLAAQGLNKAVQGTKALATSKYTKALLNSRKALYQAGRASNLMPQ